MYIFIIENAEQVSSCYHSNGGIVIIAGSRRKAFNLANKTEDVKITKEEFASSKSYEILGSHKPKVFIFINAGCC